MYLASVPSKPTNAPTSDILVTSRTQIKVTYEPIPISGDGGLIILSYELQMGSPKTLNDFVSVVGGNPYTLQTFFIVTSGIVTGENYAFRYRAINAVGAGPWSDTAILKAATVPSSPGQPYFISCNSTSVTIGLKETTDNGGSKVT